jgi:hypothetical protein
MRTILDVAARRRQSPLGQADRAIVERSAARPAANPD